MKVLCLNNVKWGFASFRYELVKGEVIDIDDSLKDKAIASGLFEVIIEDKKESNKVKNDKR